MMLVNWVWPNPGTELPTTRPAATAVAARPTTSSATITRAPILPATILPSPVPTNTPNTPLPEPEVTAMITLLGPPMESAVAIGGRLTFYWTYSEPLPPGQQFVFTLRQNETAVFTETIVEPNLGAGFQLMLHLNDLALSPGTAVWQLHLEWVDEQRQILTSEARVIILLPE